MVEDHCLQAMKIVHYYANGCFVWLISGQKSDNPLREAISILSGKYKGFTFVILWLLSNVMMNNDCHKYDSGT